jgi:hypothetical protein
MTREQSWQVEGVTLTLLRHITSLGSRAQAERNFVSRCIKASKLTVPLAM